MDSTNNVVDVEEAFEHLGFASKAKSRLKTSIDMEYGDIKFAFFVI